MEVREWMICGIMFAALAAAGCAPQRVKVDGNEYRTVVRDGQEYLCRTEAVTGSRVSTRETCRTRRQIEQAQDDVRRMQTPPSDPDLPDTQPGAY